MEWIEKLYGTTVGLDTAPLIYFIEKNSIYLDLVRPFFQAVELGEFQVVTSTLTLTEVLVHPYKYGNQTLAHLYSGILLHQRNLKTFSVSVEIATEAAQLRADYGLKTPDSIQLATALVGGATAFLTNDDKYVSIPGIQLIYLDGLLNVL